MLEKTIHNIKRIIAGAALFTINSCSSAYSPQQSVIQQYSQESAEATIDRYFRGRTNPYHITCRTDSSKQVLFCCEPQAKCSLGGSGISGFSPEQELQKLQISGFAIPHNTITSVYRNSMGRVILETGQGEVNLGYIDMSKAQGLVNALYILSKKAEK